VGTIKIDSTDAKILKILLAESRTSYTDIAKECKITVGAVRMRYKRLWRQGIINGEVTIVNPHCLGYRHIIDLGIITNSENEKDVADYLKTKPYLYHIVTHIGKYTFYSKVALRDLNKLAQIIEDLESNQKIKHVDSLIWAEGVNVEFPTNLTIKPFTDDDRFIKKRRPALTNIGQSPIRIDEMDRKIAQIVSKKSRTPFRQIAEQIGVSTKTVIQRYEKLRGPLLTYSCITLDLNKLGYSALANLYIKVSNRGKMTEIYNQLLEIPNIIVILRLLSVYDLYVAVALEDFTKMFEVADQISKINGIEKPEAILTPMFPSWPLNLFSEMLLTGATEQPVFGET
jgi:Lrp/AsnC family transcriptional regulator, regulator for asnA, asnC and gidA